MNLAELETAYQQFIDKNLSLNIERGQPSNENFDLSLPMLTAVDETSFITDNGIDVRNYPGGVLGIAEAREIFCQQIGVGPDEIILGNNSSLELMSRIFTWALLKGVNGSQKGWAGDNPKMLVTVPGYDRHFTLVKTLGFELISVPMTESGPDMEAVEQLAGNDASVKGLFFVPTYSNPTGDVISDTCAQKLVSFKAAAADFTVFADDAYAVHHLQDSPPPVPRLLELAKQHGNANRVIIFGSTSKVTFASAGIGFAGMSEDNIAFWSKILFTQSIGPNKIEQWRHVRFLRQYPGGLAGLMNDHAKILRPKFDAVQTILNRELGNRDLATWTDPKGGYFVHLRTNEPVASRVIELAANAGLTLTKLGATFPDGKDPENRTIRIAPTRPALEEVEQAMALLACCIQLATLEYRQNN